MSRACSCGRCHGCRLAWEAGERNDTKDQEAREEAEREAEELALAEELASYVLELDERDDGVDSSRGGQHDGSQS